MYIPFGHSNNRPLPNDWYLSENKSFESSGNDACYVIEHFYECKYHDWPNKIDTQKDGYNK